jgi:hypothetical protein
LSSAIPAPVSPTVRGPLPFRLQGRDISVPRAHAPAQAYARTYLCAHTLPWSASVVAVFRSAVDDLARTSGLTRDRVEVIYNPVITPDIMPARARRRTSPVRPRAGTRDPRRGPGSPAEGLSDAHPRLRRGSTAAAGAPGIPRRGGEPHGSRGAGAELAMEDAVSVPGFRDNAMAYIAGSGCSCSCPPGRAADRAHRGARRGDSRGVHRLPQWPAGDPQR